MKIIRHEKDDLDLIVYGGTLEGCDAALRASQKGLRVLLAEPRTFLGTDINASHMFRVSIEKISGYCEALTACLKNALVSEQDNFGVVHPGKLKTNLLELLRENNIEVLFMFQAAGVLTSGGAVCGAVFATKGGLIAVPSGAVLDSTLFKDLLQAAGADVSLNDGPHKVKRTIQYVTTTGELPEPGTLPENMACLFYPGYREENHIVCEYSFTVVLESGTWEQRMEAEREAIRGTSALCTVLKETYSAFSEATLFASSPELSYGENISVLCGELFDGLYGEYEDGLTPESSAEPEQAVFGKTCVTGFNDLSPIKGTDLRFGISYWVLETPESGIPELSPAQVLVAGGGTAGVPAAVSAGRHGASVTLVDYFSGLGGTTTLGGINGYYHGYKGGYTAELDERIREMTLKISTDPRHHWFWNVEARILTSLYEIEKEGGTIWFRGMTVKTLTDGNRVNGAVVSFPGGLRVIHSGITIDATGDGDIAAGAGAEFTIGDGPNMQTCNQCREILKESERVGKNIDLDIVDITKPFDLNRGILVGHKHSGGTDIVPMLTVRESRHILGDYVYDETDVLMGRRFHDTIMISDTDFDTHGLQASEIARLGFMPYHKDEKHVRFPYRVCLPKGIEGLLVTGKAFSSSKDAGAFGRMEPDLQHMGYACGKAAVMAIEAGCSLRDIDIEAFTAHLVEIGNILPDDLGEGSDFGLEPGTAVMEISSGNEGALLSALCLDAKTILPLLKDAYSHSEGKGKLLTAMALGWFGESDGEQELIHELRVQLERESPDEYQYEGRPNGGWTETPTSYWRANQLIYLLGKCITPESTRVLSSIALDTGSGGEYRDHPRLHWRRIPLFNRILNLALALRNSGDPEAAKALDSILNRDRISGFVQTEEMDGEMNYGGALLEIILAEAAAECGSSKAKEILAGYQHDIRDMLSGFAKKAIDEL